MLSDRKTVQIVALALLAVLTAAAQARPVALKSPNGALEISVATVQGQTVQAAGGQLAYRVSFRGQPVLEWSNLGLLIEGAPALGPAVRIESSKASSQDETWKSVQGKANPIRNHYNAATVQTVETAAGGRRLVMEARAYDDGVAFRYVVPEQPSVKELRILNESTQFSFSKDANSFPATARSFQTSNEGSYQELMTSALRPEMLINIPLLLNVPGIAWVGLTEADLEDYSNLYVTGSGDRTLTARLATRVENMNTSSDTVACDLPEDYKGKDGKYLPGMDFLKGLPTVWDETRGLDGKVGEYVVEARRNGKNWYLAAISDRNGHELKVPLKFLGSGTWKATLWEDAPASGQNAENMVKNEKTVRSSDTLQLKLAPSGGTVAIFSPGK